MELRRIGRLDVSVVGLGCNNFGMRLSSEATQGVVDAAIDAGINYFDTAESYGGGKSEEFLGAALGRRRGDVIIATKWHAPPGSSITHYGSREVMRTAVEGSLARLGTDYIDHYILHRPDPDTPIADTLTALDELKQEGKIREAGCSNFEAAQLDEAASEAARLGVAPFASVQNHYSLLRRDPEDDGVLAACARHGIAFVPYFPLESGVLTGKYRTGEPLPDGSRLAGWTAELAGQFIDEERLRTVSTLTEWAADRGHSLLELAMSWLAGNPQVASVICGATSPTQVFANVAAATWSLGADDLASLDAVLT
jgi:aryl-alcohol dehydrogenase-like predicted oxidoreductase